VKIQDQKKKKGAICLVPFLLGMKFVIKRNNINSCLLESNQDLKIGEKK